MLFGVGEGEIKIGLCSLNFKSSVISLNFSSSGKQTIQVKQLSEFFLVKSLLTIKVYVLAMYFHKSLSGYVH